MGSENNIDSADDSEDLVLEKKLENLKEEKKAEVASSDPYGLT